MLAGEPLSTDIPVFDVRSPGIPTSLHQLLIRCLAIGVPFRYLNSSAAAVDVVVA
jgi:hypothetical protein